MDNPPKILIVDDNPMGREALADLLFTQKYNLDFAESGLEVLAKVPGFNPDVILLDVMMPGMNGFEVCQRLKSDEQWRHIPIILVTALNSKEDLVRGLDAGADDFLPKPVTGIELKARVRSMLRIKSQYDTLQQRQTELQASLQLNQRFSQIFAQNYEALEVLHGAGLQLMKGMLNVDSVLSLISQTLLDLIPEAEGCVFHFFADNDQHLLPIVFPANNTAKMVYDSLGIETVIERVCQTGEVTYIPDVTVAPYQLQPQLPQMRSLLVTPLADEQHILGALTVYSFETYVFEERYRYSLSILAKQAAVALTKARFLEERERAKEREKWAIRDLFQRYVSPTVVDRLVEGVEDLALGGKRQEISVLFADIRGFTTFSENLPPERLVEVLNQYLALAVATILDQEGTLDKFVGDAVMAIFNAPLSQANHTLRAVRAALAMQQAIAAYNLTNEIHQCLSFGIGIHRGQAVVGNIGTMQQMNYTAIGDTVNLAKRLQENAKGGQILLSQAAYEAVQECVKVETIGPLVVKGRVAPVFTYELIGLIEKD